MGEVIPSFDLKKTLTASALLHAGVAMLLAFRISHSPQVVPIGVDLLYSGENRSLTLPKPVAKAKSSPPKMNSEEAVEATKTETETVSETATSSGPLGQKDGAVVSALERYKFELRLFLESRKIYPTSAKRLHQTGTVVVQFRVNALGELSDVILEQTSTSDALNRAALELVRNAPRFKSLPAEVNELKLSLPIEYIL